MLSLESYWLPRRKVWVTLLPLYSYPAMVTVVIFHRWHSWVELLVASILLKLAWHLLVPWKLVLRNPVPAQATLSFVSAVHVVFSKRGLTFHQCGQPRAIRDIACHVLRALDNPGQQLRSGFWCLVLGFYLGVLWLWLWSQDWNVLSNCMCMCIHQLLCTIGIFR